MNKQIFFKLYISSIRKIVKFHSILLRLKVCFLLENREEQNYSKKGKRDETKRDEERGRELRSKEGLAK